MRPSAVVLLLPLVANAADVKLVGLGYRGGEAVKAGDELTLTITNATEAGSGYPGKKATNIRIVIWNSIYLWNMCSLTGLLPAEDGNITVTIPPEMGPSGMYYEISAEGYDSPTNDTWMNIISGKNTPFIYLSGGKGSWTPAETTPELKYNGLVGFENADIPCSSYPCAQKCATQHFPLTSGWEKGSDWLNCLTACEGVAINSNNDRSKSSVNINVPSSLATPKAECKEEDLETKCGEQCCTKMEYCLSYKQCVELPLKLGDEPKSTTATAAATAAVTSTASTSAIPTVAAGFGHTLSVGWKSFTVALGFAGIIGATI